MTVTIGLVANIYNEARALPGWLECHLPFFDDVRVTHAGPRGEWSHDGTIELLTDWRVHVDFDSIDDGFGAVRSRAIRRSPCDWVMLLDADERFYPVLRKLRCSGQGTPQGEVDQILQSYDFRGVNLPNWENLGRLGSGLSTTVEGGHGDDTYNQGARLRELLVTNPYLDAVCTVRRHWHDLAMRRPTQDWNVHPDWQMRLVRNCEHVFFDPETRMHERLLGARNVHRTDLGYGPFFDHFHFHFKRMEVDQRRHDIAVYDAIHEGRKPPTWQEHKR